MAKSCPISLKRKLNSNLTFLHKYDKIIKDYLQKNIIEEVNESVKFWCQPTINLIISDKIRWRNN